MGLLEQQQGLLPATANPKMLAQALKARQTTPRNALTGQGLLDTAAIGLSPIPVIGDLLGLGADANRFINEPESRTPLNFGLAALGLIPFVPPLVSAGLGKFAQSQGKTLAQTPTGPARNQAGAIVYHGSPHKFDAFDSSKIGTGEGAQAYGHGLYFAENPATAQHYKEALTSNKISVDGNPYYFGVKNDDAKNILLEANGDINEALSKAQEHLTFFTKDQPSYRNAQKAQLAIDELTRLKTSTVVEKNPGSLYKVDLPDEAIAKMLDWDKPLSQQSPEVREVIKKWAAENMPEGRIRESMSGDEFLRFISSGKKGFGEEIMKQYGVPGIRYLDGGSRGAGQGTSNYVVFPGNEGLLKILGKE